MKQYIVDAFTDKIFSGNPAAVCVLHDCLSDHTMQLIAIENGLSETAFITKQNETYNLRWFTPGGEIDLCGHATLASAFVMMQFIAPHLTTITFQTHSGNLSITKKNNLYEMHFPVYTLKPVNITKNIVTAIGAIPKEVYIGRDLLCVFDDETTIKTMTPDFELLKQLDGQMLHVTAPGTNFDCVSRSFAPKFNILEDPVCGSGHCQIIPYWANAMKKHHFVAYQASKRGGTLYCEMKHNGIALAGSAVLYAVSEIYIDESLS